MKSICLATMIFALASCGPNSGIARAPENEDDVVQFETVPDNEIPTDGSIHVVKRGKFVIGPDTYFCTYRPGLGLDGRHLSDAIKSLGQSDYLNGSPRTNDTFGPNGLSKHCTHGAPILIRLFQTDNRTGEAYRLSLVVRQGDALWQGTVERENGLMPGVFAVADENGRAAGPSKEALSLGADSTNLSREFVRTLEVGAH